MASEISEFAGMIFLTFFLFVVFLSMAQYNAEIACPEAASIVANSTDPVTWVVGNSALFFSPCAGLDWWVYLLVFTPVAIAILIHVLPLVG